MHRTAILVTVVLVGSTASAQTPLDTSFTYQGRLTVGGGAPTGTYDLQFDVFDVPAGSAPVAPTVFRDDVAVTNGLFTVSLDFGATFTGAKRWLEVSVRPGTSTGGYTILSPRQELTASPNALFSTAAAAAPWSGLTGVPAGFADGIDNDSLGTVTSVTAGTGLTGGTITTVGTMAVDFGQVAPSGHNHGGTYQPAYQRTVVVSPVGSATANGTVLLNALAGITTASATNPYLLKIEPGVYDLGLGTLTLKPYVDIEGSGEGVTTITRVGSGSQFTGTVVTGPVPAGSVELRFLTVESTGGNTFAVAIYTDSGGSVRLTNMTAKASGAFNINIGVRSVSATPVLTNANVTASGAGAFGVLADFSFGPSIHGSRLRAGGSPSFALYVNSNTLATVSATLVDGGTSGPGVASCVGAFNASYVALNANCQ